MGMRELTLLFIGSALVNNFLLARFLGVCPFLGVTRRLPAALAMGGAVTFVMGASVLLTWPLYHWFLVPLGIEFLQYVTFILVIAGLVQALEISIRKLAPQLYDSFGIYLALITTNCAILGLALLVIVMELSFVEAMVFALGAGAGFTLAMAMMAGIREELAFADMPASLRGPAISLITAAMLALAFSGFAGLV